MRKIIWMLFVIAALSTTGIAQTNVTDGRAMNHVFAQLADGRFPDGTSYRSTLLVSNDRFAATCTWRFYGMELEGLGDGTTVTFTIPANRVIRANTPDIQEFKSGYATLSCNTPVTAQILYSFIGADGHVISEATVFSSPPATIAQLIYDVEPGVYLGVAIVNNSNVDKEYQIFTSEEFNTIVTIPARSQVARFVNEWIPNLPEQYFGIFGMYSISADLNDVYAIGLRYTGSAFTTLPVTSITP